MGKTKVIVVGTGISGLTISNLLLEKGYDIMLIEKEDKIGGLIKCDNINGNLFHKVGGHVFNSKNPNVLDWFWNKFDQKNEFIPTVRNAKIFINNRLVGYPIENYIFQLPHEDMIVVIDELLEKFTNRNETKLLTSDFKTFLINNFGDKLYELYFGPYNSKIWQTDLEGIPIDWLDGKLPMPDIRSIIRNNLLRVPDDQMVHSSFWYPQVNGSQFIVDRLAQNLNIKRNERLKSLSFCSEGLILNETLKPDIVIYTGNVKELINIIKIEDPKLLESLNQVRSLKANGTSNVLCETDDTDLSWLYLPEKQYLAHRIIYTGNFSKNNNALDSRKTCVVEFSGKHSEEVIVEELQKLPGNLRPIAFNYEPNSYVLQNPQTRMVISDLKKRLSKYNIFLLGRFAEWEYYNMDICIEKAMELSARI